MGIWSWIAGAASLCVIGVGSAAAAPLEAYGRLPAIERVAISPDGQTIAALVTHDERRQILVKEAKGDKVLALMDAGDQKIRSLLGWVRPPHHHPLADRIRHRRQDCPTGVADGRRRRFGEPPHAALVDRRSRRGGDEHRPG